MVQTGQFSSDMGLSNLNDLDFARVSIFCEKITLELSTGEFLV
jgi:hypothetical protein